MKRKIKTIYDVITYKGKYYDALKQHMEKEKIFEIAVRFDVFEQDIVKHQKGWIKIDRQGNVTTDDFLSKLIMNYIKNKNNITGHKDDRINL